MNVVQLKVQLKKKEQDKEKVIEFKTKTHIFIKKIVKSTAGLIFHTDQTRINSQSLNGKTWYKKGKTPIRYGTYKPYYVNAMYAISPIRLSHCMVFKENFTIKTCIKFFCEMIKKFRHRLYIILDNHPVHRSNIVRDFSKKNKLELSFLPAYFPEGNGSEYSNADLKHNLNYDLFAHDEEELYKNINIYNQRLISDRDKVINCFKSKDMRYVWD